MIFTVIACTSLLVVGFGYGIDQSGLRIRAPSHRPQPLLEGPLAALLEWQAMAEGAYSANTLRAQKADGAIFQSFCESRSEPHLPADPKTSRIH